MADLATGLKNPIEQKAEYLNSSDISTPEEAIEVLRELNRIGGQLIKGSVLEKSIENYLGEMDIYSINGVIEALKKYAEDTEEMDESTVPTAKINELVDDYEKYLEKGLSDEEAREKIYKENKGLVSRQNIEQFVARQREIYQETIEKLKENESKVQKDEDKETKQPSTRINNIIDLNKYREQKEAEINQKTEEQKTETDTKYKTEENKEEDKKTEEPKSDLEEKAEVISRKRFDLENKLKEKLKQAQKVRYNANPEKVTEEVKQAAEDIAEETFEEIIKNQDINKSDEEAKKIVEDLPYSVLKPDQKEKFQQELKTSIDEAKTTITVNEKANEIADKFTEELKKDERLEEVISRNETVIKEKLNDSIKEIVLGEEVLSQEYQVNDLTTEIKSIIQEQEGLELNNEALANLQTYVKSVDIELNQWINNNADEVNKFRGGVLDERIDQQILSENPNLTDEQLNNLQAYKTLLKEVYFSDPILEKSKDDAVSFAQGNASPGQVKNAWTDLKGLTNLLRRKPAEVTEIKSRYETIKKGLGDVKLPFNIGECRSFENLMNLLGDQQFNALFQRAERYIDLFAKVDKFTGGFISKTGMKVGNYIVERIGNQAVKAFAENSLKILAEQGLKQGLGTILKGILSGGVQAGASTAAAGGAAAGSAAAGGAAVAGGAALSATGVGAIVVAAVVALTAIKKIADKIKDKLGIRLFDSKKFFQENFGKFAGSVLNFGFSTVSALVAVPLMAAGAITAAAVTPIIIIGIVIIFGYQLIQGNLISSMVPPIDSSQVIPGSGGGVYDPNTHEIAYNFTIPVINGPFSRADVISVAQSIIGLPYFWGGKYPHKGANPEWGKLHTVWADGSYSTGMSIPLGLDCSGYVDWVYYQMVGYALGQGGGASSIYHNSTPISESELQPGDIAYMEGHIGLYYGTAPDGDKLFIQATGRSCANPSKGLFYGQVIILKSGKYYNGCWGSKFTNFARPNVNFVN